jgi:dihydropyrimidinase
VTHELLHDNVGYTPYEGMRLQGWPVTVVSRGRIVVEDGELRVEPGSGNYLERQPGHAAAAPSGVLAPELDPARNFGATVL